MLSHLLEQCAHVLRHSQHRPQRPGAGTRGRAALAVERLEDRIVFDCPGPDACIVAGPDPAVPAETLPFASLRIGTFNTQFLDPRSRIWDPQSFDWIPDRPAHIAQRIIASGYDVIALQEVFDEPRRAEFVAALRDEFPFHVQNLAHPDRFTLATDSRDDSGLMLFSRFPFVEFPGGIPEPFQLPNDDDDVAEISDVAVAAGAEWNGVAYTSFTDCAGTFSGGSDCLANKGAGLVRIRNPYSDDIYNVVFTHMDAGDGGVAVRYTQLAQIRTMMEALLPDIGPHTPEVLRENVLLLGDLNIHGEANGEYLPEWPEYFGDGATLHDGFFRYVVHDVWRNDTQHDFVSSAFSAERVDLGLTKPTVRKTDDAPEKSQDRLDYILHNTLGGFAVQHMTVDYGLFEGGQPLSDHHGLKADINRWAPRCTPVDAAVIVEPLAAPRPAGEVFDLKGGQALIDGKITFPGSMQWYLITEPGTYTLAVDGNSDVDFEIYKSTDLSRPYQGRGYMELTRDVPITMSHSLVEPGADFSADWGKEPLPLDPADIVGTPRSVTGRVYALAEGPFYVRVFASHRNATGDYTLVVDKHDGSSKEEAIVLFPNVNPDGDFRFPTSKLGPNRRYFRLDTETPDSGGSQQLKFVVTPRDADAGNSYSLYLEDAAGVIWAEDEACGADRATAALPLAIDRSSGRIFNGQTLFMRVDACAATYQYNFDAFWATDLIVVHSSLVKPRAQDPTARMMLTAEEDLDRGPAGADVTARLTADIVPAGTSAVGPSPVVFATLDSGPLGEFNQADSKAVPWQVFRFTPREAVRLGWHIEDYDIHSILSDAGLPQSDAPAIDGPTFSQDIERSPEPLAGSFLQALPQLFENGRYRFDFLVSHGLQDGGLAGQLGGQNQAVQSQAAGSSQEVGGTSAGLQTLPDDGETRTETPAVLNLLAGEAWLNTSDPSWMLEVSKAMLRDDSIDLILDPEPDGDVSALTDQAVAEAMSPLVLSTDALENKGVCVPLVDAVFTEEQDDVLGMPLAELSDQLVSPLTEITK